MDIDNIDNVHPFHRIWYHPLWKEAIESLELSDYKDSPHYSSPHLVSTSNVTVQFPLRNVTLDDTMRRANSEIIDKIGNLGTISLRLNVFTR